MFIKRSHTYHLVSNSPWPFTTTITVLTVILGIIMSMNNIEYSKLTFISSINLNGK